jgi:CheY-like chemotaxis protein
MRVLLVEDSDINRRIVREMLTAGGVELDEACDGQEGVERAKTAHYDLVLMDLRMPRMDGLTAIRHIRALPELNGSVPIIVITADAGSTIQIDCAAAGADEVIAKPVSMPVLFDAIGRILARDGAQVMLT